MLDNGGLLLDCSSLGLTSIPDNLPPNTKQLLLHHNAIQRVEQHAFWSCRRWLSYLDLADNDLLEIHGDAFLGLDRLETLLLHRNLNRQAFPAPEVFSRNFLGHLGELKTLDLHEFWLLQNFSSSDQLQELIGNLTNLRSLSFSSYSNASFQGGFATVTNLEELYVYGKYTHFENSTFQAYSSSSIRTLVVRSGVRKVQPLAFAHFKHLEALDLSYNAFHTPERVSNCWLGLQYTNVSTLALVSILDDLYQLGESFYFHLERTKLKKLLLDDNMLTSIGNTSWFAKYLPHLEYLSLENNRLMASSDTLLVLKYLPNLKFININNQMSFTSLHVNENFITRVCLDKPLPGDVHSKPDDCRLYAAGTSGGASGSFALTVFPSDSLEFLFMASIGDITGKVSGLVVFAAPNLRYINYAKNYLSRVDSPVVISHHQQLLTIDLSLNQCVYLGKTFGQQAGRVTRVLYLGQNRLGEQLNSDVNGTALEGFTEVTELDLSYNSLRNLYKYVFKAQMKMEVLNLAHNYLQLLTFDFKHMVNLTYLDLSGNLFHQLSQENRHDLNSLASDHTLSVALADNPLVCSCDTLQFLHWVVQIGVAGRINLVSWQDWTCTYRGDVVKMAELESSILHDLDLDCQSTTILIGASISLVLIVLIIAVSLMLYRHRFEIRYLMLKLVVKRKEYDAVLNEQADYTYDAFVAFDMADVEWISDVLLPELEGENEDGFHLCVHHRDFKGGVPIVENIADAILSSRKVIVILTRNFLASSWCQFELETTQVRAFEEGKDLVIPVLLEDLPAANMSKTLRTLLKRNTYIMWPEHHQEITNFWVAIRKALSSKSARLIRCQCGNNINP